MYTVYIFIAFDILFLYFVYVVLYIYLFTVLLYWSLPVKYFTQLYLTISEFNN